jgi:xanthine/uracil/vitamin C permease (AzgA family)
VLERLFHLADNRTTVRTELVTAGVTKPSTGRAREAHALVNLCAALFVARYVWLMK